MRTRSRLLVPAVLALVIGVGITVASAVVPAWRSSKVPPVAAMSEVSIDRSTLSRARLAWGSLFLVAGIALFVLGVTDTGPTRSPSSAPEQRSS